MSDIIEQPVTITTDTGDTITTHPSYALIGASRVQGGVYLNGSDFRHHNFITITIKTAERHRCLGRDWSFGEKEVIQVALSEAQWATFVSTMNVGDGVDCTIQRKSGSVVPQLPKPDSPKNKAHEDIGNTLAELQTRLRELANELGDGAVSKTKAADIRRQMGWLADALTSNVEYTAKTFGEYVETTIEKAKIEVNAYATNIIHRTGIAALTDSAVVPVIEYRTDDQDTK